MYPAGTGRLCPERRCRKFNEKNAGKEAFTHRNAYGYQVGLIDDVLYFAHRIIWKMQTGSDPKHQLDHINLVRDDNRICNLREADNFENGRNKRPRRGTKSKFKGVNPTSTDGTYIARVFVDQRTVNLGYFYDEVEAARAYDAAALKYYGEFARLNFPQGA